MQVRARRVATEFRFHDLRHYLASLLISQGLDVKVVQYRLRHAAATTTLNVYAHLWTKSDESARAVIGDVMTPRATQSTGRSRPAIAAEAIAAHHQCGAGLDPGGPAHDADRAFSTVLAERHDERARTTRHVRLYGGWCGLERVFP